MASKTAQGASMRTVVCVGCSKRFRAKSPRRKWCEPSCRTRTERARKAAAEAAQAEAERGEKASRLVDQLREELEQAGVADSFDGLLAIELAERVGRASAQGFPALVRQLREVKASALGRELPAPPGAGVGVEDDEGPSGPDPGEALLLSIEAEVGEARARAAAAG